jgi:hypothetical protein
MPPPHRVNLGNYQSGFRFGHEVAYAGLLFGNLLHAIARLDDAGHLLNKDSGLPQPPEYLEGRLLCQRVGPLPCTSRTRMGSNPV